jgi:hypothetical protein
MMEGPEAMIFRRRNSSINVAAIATASIPERHAEQPRLQLAPVFRSKRTEAELRAQSAKLLATRLHTHGVVASAS